MLCCSLSCASLGRDDRSLLSTRTLWFKNRETNSENLLHMENICIRLMIVSLTITNEQLETNTLSCVL